MKSDIWVVLPAYNEGSYLNEVLKKLKKKTSNYIIVDDGSRDDTVGIAEKFTGHVLIHPLNLGKGAALKTGATYAFETLGAKAVIFMDADDQHDPDQIPEFVKLLKKWPVVFGRRSLDNQMPIQRRLSNKLLSILVWLIYGKYVPDILCGYNALSKESYDKLQWQAQTYDVELELVVRVILANLPHTTVKVKTIYHDLDRGMTVLDAVRVITELLQWRLMP